MNVIADLINQQIYLKDEQTDETTYDSKLSEFIALLQQTSSSKIEVFSGRKYDRVYTKIGNKRICHYMITKPTGYIFGTKSWTTINGRRFYGTLNMVDQYKWSTTSPVPLPGTSADAGQQKREATIKSTYKKRGRPRKVVVLSAGAPDGWTPEI